MIFSGLSASQEALIERMVRQGLMQIIKLLTLIAI